jgi:hypothetical protein
VELFIFENDSPMYSSHRADLEGLREVNFSIMGHLPMGRINHPLLIFVPVVIVPLKAMASP